MPDVNSVAITGAHGTVGQEVARLCASKGYRSIQTNRSEGGKVEVSNTEERIADIAGNYEETLNAVKGSDAIIHIAAIPNPVDEHDANVHGDIRIFYPETWRKDISECADQRGWGRSNESFWTIGRHGRYLFGGMMRRSRWGGSGWQVMVRFQRTLCRWLKMRCIRYLDRTR